MKVITLRNPIAAQVVFAFEDDVRMREGTKYRGPVLIHAAGEMSMKARRWDLPHEELLQRVIGMAVLDRVTRANTGWHHWEFSKAMVFPEPVQARGYPGLWDLDGQDIEDQIKKAMRPDEAQARLGYTQRMNERIADSVHPRRRDGWVGD